MRHRTCALVLAVLVAGCATGTDIEDYWTEPESDALDVPDVWDVTDLPAEDPGWDPGVDPDAVTDPEADPIPDPVADPDAEPEPDVGCVPVTSGGVCNIVEQCGCMPPGWCRFEQDDSTCTVVERCHFTSTAGGTHGSVCSDMYDCSPGHSCFVESGGTTGQCQKWCRSASDCPSGTCTQIVNWPLRAPCSGETTAPLNVCTLM
jgi:hypothetical protein